MPTPLPTDIFEGYTFDGTNLIIPLAALQEAGSPGVGLTAAEASETTGNGGRLIVELVKKASKKINALTSDKKPVNVKIVEPPPSAVSGQPNAVNRVWNVSAKIDLNTGDVVSEP